MFFYKRLTQKFLTHIEWLEYGTLTIQTPDEKKYEIPTKQQGKPVRFFIKDWRTIFAFAQKGEIGLAESYFKGWWQADNLTELLLIGLKNEILLESYIYGSKWSQIMARLMYFLRKNTLSGSRKNIMSHYDLGNDFYKLWLDEGMTYSSALFLKKEDTLIQAQKNKYGRILERLEERSGSILEIGCGWGGFIEEAMKHGDYDIKGITLSHEQKTFSDERLGDKAEIALEDYRKQDRVFDYIVSIEMFEAVGESYWGEYFKGIRDSLKQTGKALIQTITIDDSLFEKYRKGGDIIRTFIFPGGMLPSPKRFREEVEKQDLKITDQFSFGKDYARTLAIWLSIFDLKREEIKTLGFDDRFIRLWRFYLAVCEAGFETSRINVSQFEIQHR